MTSVSDPEVGTGSQFPLDDATLQVDFLSSRVVRLRLVFANEQPPGQSVALPRADINVSSTVENGRWTARTNDVSVEVDTSTARVEIRDLVGNMLLQAADARCFVWEFVTEDRRRLQARFKRATEEHFYGLGQAGPRLDKDGTTRRLWNSHYGYGPGSDMAVPLLISSRGYALFFDNSWDSEISIGRNDGGNTLVYTAEGGQFDCYFLYGPGPKEILSEYARLTGAPTMPPRWALGYIQSTRHFESPQEIVDLVEMLRQKQIPCDVIVFLSTYGADMGMNNGVGTLEFHPELWADSAGLIRELKDRNFQVIWHEYPVLGPRSEAYDEARQEGYLVDYSGSTSSGTMFGQGQRFVDFTNPAAGAWWWSKHQPLVEAGVDGWWLDGGEGPPAAARLHTGAGAAFHNVFDLNRQRVFAEGERGSRPQRRPWMLCRSGYAGMQRLGSACWSGDINNTFDVLEVQVPLGLSTAMSGVPYWGTDIGGFFHTVPETAELYVRWFQFAAFCPVFRSHGRGTGLRGWREHLPWAHGSEVEQICRSYAELRYQLFPYNYSLAWQAHRRGTPLMRPLVLEFPDDRNVVDMGSEYMWGPSLLVAPVTRGGATRWAVYLPGGTWYDFWTHDRYDGGGWVEVDAPLEHMPLFVRGGAILPFAPTRQYLADGDGTLTLLVYPEAESSFTLYQDDGVSWEYENGAYALTDVHCSASETGVRLKVDAARGQYTSKPETRTVLIQMYMPSPPADVTLTGIGPLPPFSTRHDLDNANVGWWHDGAHFVWVRLPSGDASIELELTRP
jgi:alpha-glucosidase